MPIDTNCPSCGRLLRVGDEHAGRQARCPMCNTIYVIPEHAAATVESSAAAQPPPKRNPFADRDDEPPWAKAATGSFAPGMGNHYTPHRGVLILVLGVLGWAFGCFLLGAFAWVMGNADLREMDQGRMDPAGRGLTQAGRILGMIQTLLTLLGLLIGLTVLIFVALMAA